jgi:NADPH:quinone reductase-like Zn-dependent oxidoreductase
VAEAMRAVRLNEIGGPEKLHVEQIPKPEPQAGEVLIKVARAAFNRRDVFITQGLYPGIQLPVTPGSDGFGHVAALGTGAKAPPVGTPVVMNPEIGWEDDPSTLSANARILGMPIDGTFAEYVIAPAENVFAKPANLGDDEAAAIPLAGLTAYRAAFTRGGLTKDDVVFIPGIGSGVQTMVLSYAVHVGARTIVTSGSDEKLAHAKALGASEGVNYKTNPDWHKDVRKLSDGGPTLTVDCNGGEVFARALDIARFGGRVVSYGGTNGDAKIRPFSIFWKHLSVLGTSMGSPSDFAAMLALFGSGLKPVVDRVFPMDDVVDAAERVLKGEQMGKVVLAIS